MDLGDAPESRCRGCGRSGLQPLISLGEMPLANALLSEEQLQSVEACYPLDLAMCTECTLVQITVSIPPEELFTEYAYFSSYSPTVVANAQSLVQRVIEERRLGPQSLAMEIASNDGYLLATYVEAGVPVLGVDPAENVAEVAEGRGVPTRCDFFGEALGQQLRDEGRRADVIHANNVMAHVPDINGVIRGMERVLSVDGVVIIETPYVRDMVEGLEFDTIYHEHLFYYSLTSLQRLFERNGLAVVDVERIPIHGGTLRVTAARAGTQRVSDAALAMLAEESQLGLDHFDYYASFGERVRDLCGELKSLLDALVADGRQIAGYGAAAKATVMLNALGVGRETLQFIADRSPVKQGRYLPGVHIPIVAPELILETMPDYVFIHVWNFADEVMRQLDDYSRQGGRFIVPVPKPVIL